jgi:hypothetical protein
VVFSIGDLNDPVQYIDRAQSSFIAVDGAGYRMGTAVDAVDDPSKDMTQFSGRVEDCSTPTFWCKSIAYLKLVLPKDSLRAVSYQIGTDISITPTSGGGWHASATCWRLLPSGCASRVGDAAPAVTYQYDVSGVGDVTVIQIQYRDSRGVVVDHQDLRLSTKLGLRLN